MVETFEQTDARFQKFASVFSDTLKQNEQLRDAMKTLQADLEVCRATCGVLQREILEKVGGESETVQYTRLLAKINDLETAAALQKQNENNIQAQFDEEKLQLLRELEKEKQAHIATELKLTNDLQLANDLAAIQYDELELKMQERVGSLMTQLKESTNKCNVLRSEVFSLKQRLANNNADEKIKRLEEKLRNAEEQLKNNAQSDERSKQFENYGESSSSAIKIIDYDKERFVNSIAFKTNVSFNQCHVTEKQTKNSVMRKKSGFPLPPLKQLETGKTIARKRKLHNPDDLRYLEEETQD